MSIYEVGGQEILIIRITGIDSESDFSRLSEYYQYQLDCSIR